MRLPLLPLFRPTLVHVPTAASSPGFVPGEEEETLWTQHMLRGSKPVPRHTDPERRVGGAAVRPDGTLQGPPSRLKGTGWAAGPRGHPSWAGRWDRERDPLRVPSTWGGVTQPRNPGVLSPSPDPSW